MSAGYQLNTSSAFRYHANRENVTLYDAAGSLVCTVQDAKRLMQSLAERAPSDGEYLYVPVDFRLPGQNVSGAVQPGWTIHDAASVAYVVQEVDPPGTYNGTYNCSCLSLMVLGHTITWSLPTDATDGYASPITNQTTKSNPLPCAIKEIQSDPFVFQNVVQGTQRRYLIWFVGDLTLNEGAIGTDELGNAYTVTAIRNRNRIDELIEVECVIQP